MTLPSRVRHGVWLLVAALVCLSFARASAKDPKPDTPPRIIHAPDPIYPEAARRDKIQGTVVVQLHLDTDGIPHDIKVLRGLRQDLDDSALAAVSTWRFEPAEKDGVPIAVTINVEVAFRLR